MAGHVAEGDPLAIRAAGLFEDQAYPAGMGKIPRQTTEKPDSVSGPAW